MSHSLKRQPREPIVPGSLLRPGALLKEGDVAAITGFSVRSIQDWRLRGRGPALPFVRIGRSIRYRAEDVQRLIDSNVQAVPGAEGGAA
jgi:hypothetical protein